MVEHDRNHDHDHDDRRYEYPRARVDELPDTPNPTAHKKEVDEALDVNAFGFNVYVARPGERLPWGYHYHPEHEELLYVIEGELAVETPATRTETGGFNAAFHVTAGEALFVPPNTPQRARAVGEHSTTVIAVGAPKNADSAVIAEYCPACETTTDRTHEPRETENGTVYVLSCADCGTETDRFGAGPS